MENDSGRLISLSHPSRKKLKQLTVGVKALDGPKTTSSFEFQGLGECNALIFGAFVLWGMSSWITINSIFVELPTFATSLPEGWALGSQMGLVAQISNIFPLMYFLIAQATHHKPSPSVMIFTLLVIGTASSPLLGFFWSKTTHFFGRERSLWLLLLTLVGGIVDCTTSLVYWPFVASYKTIYISALAVGEGLSGGAVSILGLLQDQGGASTFSTQVFFLLVAAVMAFSALGFAIIRFSRLGREAVQGPSLQGLLLAEDSLLSPLSGRKAFPESLSASSSGREGLPLLHPEAACSTTFTKEELWRIAAPLAVLFGVNFVENGMVPSITTYAFLAFPQGKHVMSVSINAALIISPLASLVTSVFRLYRLLLLSVMCIIPTFYVLYTSLSCSAPVLQEFAAGAVIVGVTFVLMRALLAYTKAVALIGMKEIVELEKLERAYFFCGFMTQLGSGVGSLLFFILVNYTSVFTR